MYETHVKNSHTFYRATICHGWNYSEQNFFQFFSGDALESPPGPLKVPNPTITTAVERKGSSTEDETHILTVGGFGGAVGAFGGALPIHDQAKILWDFLIDKQHKKAVAYTHIKINICLYSQKDATFEHQSKAR